MMLMCIEKKKKNVKFLFSLCENNQFIAVATYSFISALKFAELRMLCFKLGSTIRVVKNSLVRISLLSTKYEMLTSDLKQSTIFIFIPLNIKEVLNIVKTFVKFKGFFFENRFFNSKFFEFFFSLPTKEESCRKFIYVLLNLIKNFINLLLFIFKKFIKILNVVKNIFKEKIGV